MVFAEDYTMQPVDNQILQNVFVIFRFENIPTTYLTNNNTLSTMFFNCFLYDEKNIIANNELELITIYNEDNYSWSYTPNISNRVISKWMNFYSPDYSYDGSVLPLGTYTIQIKFKNGQLANKQIDTTSLLLYNNNKYKYIYSPTYSGSLTQDYLPALARADIKSASITNNTTTIIFTCNDDRIRNGCLDFYSGTQLLNYTLNFYNSFSKQNIPFLNNGNGLYTDGRDNILVCNSSDVFFKNNSSLSDINTVVITLINVENPIPAKQVSDTVILSSKTEKYVINQ
jgi:hypothetical protein